MYYRSCTLLLYCVLKEKFIFSTFPRKVLKMEEKLTMTDEDGHIVVTIALCELIQNVRNDNSMSDFNFSTF